MFREIKRQLTDSDFVKELNTFEIEGVKSILQNVFIEEYGDYFKHNDVEDYFGLAYTSTGAYATIENTNTEFEIADGYYLSHFAITKNDMLVAVAYDENDNEKFFEVEF